MEEDENLNRKSARSKLDSFFHTNKAEELKEDFTFGATKAEKNAVTGSFITEMKAGRS